MPCPTIDNFRSIFESDTGTIMTSPNSLTKELVCRIVKEFSLDTVFRDLGILIATALANTIESRGLRPADYAELPDLADDLSERLMQELGRNPDTFALAFLTQLRNRG